MKRMPSLMQWVGLFLAAVLAGTSGQTLAAPVWAQADDPTVTSVQPNRAANDVDTPLEVSGADFSAEGDGPQVFLGDTPLLQVTWVNTQTLTTLVPWGLTPGVYPLRVVNPTGGEATLAAAFEVTQGVGQWNASAMDGGPVRVVLPVSQTAGLLYAYSVVTSGLYRSTDYGAHWVTAGHASGQFLAYDPLDPQTLYLNAQQSRDGGTTWQGLLPDGHWPGTDQYPGYYTQAFPDPAQAGTLFLATADIPVGSGSPAGLARSADYGQTWETIENGLPVTDTHITAVEFYSHTVFVGTRDGNVYRSTDGGDSWQALASTGLPSVGVLRVNPYQPAELWVTTHAEVTAKAQIVKIDLADPGFVVSPVSAWPVDAYPLNLGFLSAGAIYIGTQWDGAWMSEDGGANWALFHPSTGKPGYCLALDPWDSQQDTFYIADEQYGVQKTVDHGLSWTPVNAGLHAMSPDYLAIDPANPARVYAKISENGWPGIFISADGGQRWDFASLEAVTPGRRPITSMLAVSAGRVFAGAHGNEILGYGPQLFVSDNQGDTWKRVDVDPLPLLPDSFHMPWNLQVDPREPRTLLLAAVIGNRDLTPDEYVSELYRSTDQGDSWQRVNLTAQVGHAVHNLTHLAFAPNNPDLVYAAGDHDILKSTDNGGTWSIIASDAAAWLGGPIAIEPVPPYRVFVGNQVSADGGETWDWANLPVNPSQMAFVPGSDTLYAAGDGLMVSHDGGTTWQAVAGTLASTRINGLAVSRHDQRTVIYVGTPGGDGVSPNIRAAHVQAESLQPLEAGVYRLTEVRYSLFLPLVRR